jgi:hypothetical protein
MESQDMTDHNHGWILTSERLPTEKDAVDGRVELTEGTLYYALPLSRAAEWKYWRTPRPLPVVQSDAQDEFEKMRGEFLYGVKSKNISEWFDFYCRLIAACIRLDKEGKE